MEMMKAIVLVDGKPQQVMLPPLAIVGNPHNVKADSVIQALCKVVAQQERKINAIDKLLRGIAEARPASLAELARIEGVGETKLKRYGEAMLAAVAGFEEAAE